jgi:hypothetical protein
MTRHAITIGEVFKDLTVLGEVEGKPRHRAVSVRCICGNIKVVGYEGLRAGSIRSCGCWYKRKRMNLEGRTFGQLKVLTEVEPINKQRMWRCLCSCGKQHDVAQLHLTRKKGGTRSCGCVYLKKKYPTKNLVYYRRLYNVWKAMHYRCYKPGNRQYANYGGRGIRISKDWHNFAGFYNDMIDTYEPGLTIERIDVDGDYCLENCTWITNEAQASNRRSSLAYRERTGYVWHK